VALHRSMIADSLKASGLAAVLHITGRQETSPHPYTSVAQVEDGVLSYGDGSLSKGAGGVKLAPPNSAKARRRSSGRTQESASRLDTRT